MTNPALPVSRLINVAVNLTPAAAAAQNLSTLLILGSSAIIDIVERYRIYTSLTAVAADFGTTLPEYLAAALWFQQVPQPSQLLIGRWDATASSGILRCAPLSAASQAMSIFNVITTGKFTYSLDAGGPFTTGNINLSGAANLPAVATLIAAQTAGLNWVWNQNFNRFEATSATTGALSYVSFLTPPGTGTDISAILGGQATQSGAYTVPGQALESAVSAVTLFDNNYGQAFYGVAVLGAADSDHLAIAAAVAGMTNKRIYFITTQEAGVLVAATTSDIAYQMKQLNYTRVWVQYSSSNPYAAISAAARILTVDYTGNATVITLFYKQEPGITAETLNATQIAALEGKNCNVFVTYNNNTAIMEPGMMTSGNFLDTLTGTDWLSLTIQAALYNLLYTSLTKIPQTDAGTQQMINAIESVCAQAVINGLLAPGNWGSQGFGVLNSGDFMPKGYYVWAPKVSTQSAQSRAARLAVPIQVAAKLAGAVHTIAMTINVNL